MYNKQYPSDKFTENDVLNCLQAAGLEHKNGSRYILTQCPTHDDRHPSAQIYKDDWFVSCNAGCGRFHITKPFPGLLDNGRGDTPPTARQGSNNQRPQTVVTEQKYITYDLMDDWQKMPLIPRDHNFKNISLETLDDLGWRWDEKMYSYFIPYFSRSKKSVPFAQWRHLAGERRFTMLKDARPTMYGTWNIMPDNKLFVVEGTSDCAVLEACAIPWVGAPSASSGELVRAMAAFCFENGVELVYAGDNDDAGDKLREAIEREAPYRVKQPPKKYKDWGDFYVAEGMDVVMAYCHEELFGAVTFIEPTPPKPVLTAEDVLASMPGAQIIDNSSAGVAKSKEQSAKPATLF